MTGLSLGPAVAPAAPPARLGSIRARPDLSLGGGAAAAAAAAAGAAKAKAKFKPKVPSRRRAKVKKEPKEEPEDFGSQVRRSPPSPPHRALFAGSR